MSDKDIETKLKASEDLLNGLHQMVAQKLIKMINKPDATVQDINAAIKFLKDNDVTADIQYNKPIQALEHEVTSVGELPFIEEDTDEEAV
jgi:50S ribosomal subunit-associated GTPase HflX